MHVDYIKFLSMIFRGMRQGEIKMVEMSARNNGTGDIGEIPV
jgi:hypothetical protein